MPENIVNQDAHPSLPIIDSQEIGKEYAPLSANHIANPYPFYAHARQEDPVFYSPLLDMWVVTRYDDITTVIKDHRRFSFASVNPRAEIYTPEVIALLRTGHLSSVASLTTSEPPDHTRLRSCANKVLATQLARLEPHLRHIANQLIDAFESQEQQEQIDFMEQFARPYPLLATSYLLGLPEADMPQLEVWIEQVRALLFADISAEQQLIGAQSLVALQQYIHNLVEQGQRTSQDTFTSILLNAMETGQAAVSKAEAEVMLFEVLASGIATIGKGLGSCLHHLLAERRHWQSLVDDPHLIPALVEEALRLDSPGLYTFRRTNEVVELGGKTLPKGARIHVVLASANHDEAVFPDAGTLCPHRQNAHRHVAFGYGIHFCPGAPLVRLALRIALEQLSQRLPSLHLVPDQEMSYKGHLLARALKHLLVMNPSPQPI